MVGLGSKDIVGAGLARGSEVRGRRRHGVGRIVDRIAVMEFLGEWVFKGCYVDRSFAFLPVQGGIEEASETKRC